MFFYRYALMKNRKFGIVTFIDDSYKPLLQNFLCNMDKLNLTKYVHIYLAGNKLEHLVQSKNVSYTIVNSISSSVKSSNYGDDFYWYISKQKTIAFLEATKNFEKYIFTDVDVLWIKNPLLDLESFCDVDICFQSNTPNGYKKINSGFFFVKKSKGTLNFFKQALNMSKTEKYRYQGDQDILIDIVKRKKKNAFWKFLKLDKYPNGGTENVWKNQKNSSIFVIHNNWIVSLGKKIERFISVDGWFLDKNSNCIN